MSRIEWTEKTWNPVVGCSMVSAGCKHCYAEVMARRLAAMPGTRELYGQVVHGADAGHGLAGKWNGRVVLNRKALEEPLRRKKPTVYFVNSMSDLFHESVGDGWLDEIFGVMAACPQHVFQVLTKRPGRMREYVRGILNHGGTEGTEDGVARVLIARGGVTRGGEVQVMPWPLRNVWLGVSVEDQAAADARIPVLLDTPAVVRFLSCEPLLGAVDLEMVCLVKKKPGSIRAGIHINALGGHYQESGRPYIGDWDIEQAMPVREPRKLDWVIAGGESGHGARIRPMHPVWVRGIRDACVKAGVPFFFKQWGEWAPGGGISLPGGAVLSPLVKTRFIGVDGLMNGPAPRCVMYRVGKTLAGRVLDGRVWDEMPERI